jgi:hypothetical protein
MLKLTEGSLNTQSWTPFKDPRSLPMVTPDAVEYIK